MKAKERLEELEALAEKLGVKTSYERFTGEGMGPGGLCKVRGRWRVIIDRRNSPDERAAIIAESLTQLDDARQKLQELYVSPQVRQMLERYADQ
jgi:hypothetical protein